MPWSSSSVHPAAAAVDACAGRMGTARRSDAGHRSRCRGTGRRCRSWLRPTSRAGSRRRPARRADLAPASQLGRHGGEQHARSPTPRCPRRHPEERPADRSPPNRNKHISLGVPLRVSGLKLNLKRNSVRPGGPTSAPARSALLPAAAGEVTGHLPRSSSVGRPNRGSGTARRAEASVTLSRAGRLSPEGASHDWIGCPLLRKSAWWTVGSVASCG